MRSSKRYTTKIRAGFKIGREETVKEIEKEINTLLEDCTRSIQPFEDEINWLENRPKSNPKRRY